MSLSHKILGYVGCSIMSSQGIPQTWRVYKNKSGADLSYTTLCMSCIGGGLTIAYGVLINEPPIYATVSFTVLNTLVLVYLKALYGSTRKEDLSTLSI